MRLSSFKGLLVVLKDLSVWREALQNTVIHWSYRVSSALSRGGLALSNSSRGLARYTLSCQRVVQPDRQPMVISASPSSFSPCVPFFASYGLYLTSTRLEARRKCCLVWKGNGVDCAVVQAFSVCFVPHRACLRSSCIFTLFR